MPVVPRTDTATRLRAASQALMGTKSGSKFCQLLEQAAIELESLSGPSHKPAAVEALKGVLDEIEDYLEQRQDVRDGSDGPRANTGMSLLSDLRWWRDSAGMCSATPQHTKENV
jgi:hypothetical protein